MSGPALLLLLLACGPKHPLRPPGSPTAPPGTAAGCPSADLPLRALPIDAAAWPDDTSPEIARVWGTSITEAQFRAAAAKKVPSDGAALSAAERQEVLDVIIAERLLYLDALRKGYDRQPTVQKVMINSMLREELYAQVRSSDFTDEMLQRYFKEHNETFIAPEKLQIRTLLVAAEPTRSEAEALALALNLYQQIVSRPNEMKDLAALYSSDAYRRRGGDVGYIAQDGKPGLDPRLVDLAWSLPLHQVSKPLAVPEGFVLVRVEARREEVHRTFEEMRGSVLRLVTNETLKTLYDSRIAELRQGAPIEVDAAALGQIKVTFSRATPGLDPVFSPEEALEEEPLPPAALP